MARVALLIGTENYGKEFGRLEAAPRNVRALTEVLGHPEMGGFELVTPLIDPDHSQMAETIETWLSERDKDDFVLLYIAGHGVKDVKRKLYFAASKTVKNKLGELVTSTAVAARNVHDWLQGSKAKQQIVILDCCFSGAFGDLLAQDDGAVDVEGALGAEGRVVLTSSSSMQYSFQQREGALSVYTHHLLEGITSGAADDDDDGKISIDELHRYTSRKVQEESPGMTPQIIVMKDAGYRLRIANAPLGDPKVQYRKEVEKIIEEDKGRICSVFSRPLLNALQQKLAINNEIAIEIEDSALEPIRQHNRKLKSYRNVVRQALQNGRYPFGIIEIKRLYQLRKILGLSEAEAQHISTQETSSIDTVELMSDRGVDYDRLRELLINKQWKEADRETFSIILRLSNRTHYGSLNAEGLSQIPCVDLRTIDRLWSKSSNSYFGFSTQIEIWEESGRPLKFDSPAWRNFCVRLGWREQESYIDSSELIASLPNSPLGELPGGGWQAFFGLAMFLRVEECGI
jgi:hypothetical protein